MPLVATKDEQEQLTMAVGKRSSRGEEEGNEGGGLIWVFLDFDEAS